MDEEEICNICLDPLNPPHGQPRVTGVKLVNCAHMFCKGCIDKWSKIKRECPVCKRKGVKYEVMKFKRTRKKGLMEVEGDWSDDDRPIPTGGFGLEITGRGVGGGVVEYANDGGTPKWTWDKNDDQDDEEEEVEEIFTRRVGSSSSKKTIKTPTPVVKKSAKKNAKKGMRSFGDLDSSSDSDGEEVYASSSTAATAPRRPTSTPRRLVPRRATPMFKTPSGHRGTTGSGGFVEEAIKAWKSDLRCRRSGLSETSVAGLIDGAGNRPRQAFLQCCAMWLTPREGSVPDDVRTRVLAEVKRANCRRGELRGTGGLGKIVLWHASRGDGDARGIIEGWCQEGGRGG